MGLELIPKEVTMNDNLKPIRHDPEPDGDGKPKAQADLGSSHGRIVAEHGYDPVYDPVKPAAFPDKEAACKKADIIDRRNDIAIHI